MANESNDAVSYLRALKQAGSTDAASTATAPALSASPSETPAAAPTGAAQGAAQYTGPEKRRSPRYKCQGSAEMCEDGNAVHTWSTFTDISMHGCYVEATATYPVGTAVDMRLEANGYRVRTKGTVRVSYPYLGMGIAFTEMAEEDRGQLKQLLRTISRPSVIMGPGIATAASGPTPFESLPLISDPTAAIRTLVEFFDSRHMLMRDEFLRLLRVSQSVDVKPNP